MLVARRQRFGADHRLLQDQVRDEAVLGEALVHLAFGLRILIFGARRSRPARADSACRRRAAPSGCCSRLPPRATAARRRSTPAARCGSLSSRTTVSGVTCTPGRMMILSTRPCVDAGTQRRASSTGTSVPRPRTWRTIGPRLTMSTQTVARSTVGAAGFNRASTTDTAAMTMTADGAKHDLPALLGLRDGCGTLNVHCSSCPS